jgi:ketosteroid isomerase-like protein
MSREIDTLRAMYDAFGRGDFDEAAQYIHPEAELRPALEPLEQGGLILGRDGIKEFLESLGLWESRRVEFEEVIEAGGRVLVVERWHVTAREDMKLDFELIDVYQFQGGLIFRVNGFRDRDEALTFVGVKA